RGHPRHHAQELAHVAESGATKGQNLARLSGGNIDAVFALAHAQMAAIGPVIAVNAAQDRALSRSGGALQRQALAALDGEAQVREHREYGPASKVEREALVEVLDLDGGGHGLRLRSQTRLEAGCRRGAGRRAPDP